MAPSLFPAHLGLCYSVQLSFHFLPLKTAFLSYVSRSQSTIPINARQIISRIDFAFFVNNPETIPGLAHECIARYIDFKINDYLKTCRAVGGLVGILSEDVRCTGSAQLLYNMRFDSSFQPKSQRTSSSDSVITRIHSPANHEQREAVRKNPPRHTALATGPPQHLPQDSQALSVIENSIPSPASYHEKSYGPDSAWQLVTSDGGRLVIEVATSQRDASINDKVEAMIANRLACSVIVVRNRDYNKKGACIELYKPEPDGKGGVKAQRLYRKDFLNSSGELDTSNTNLTADLHLEDFLDTIFLDNFDLLSKSIIRKCPKLRISLNQLGKEELKSREDRVTMADLAVRVFEKAIALSEPYGKRGPDDVADETTQHKSQRVGS